MKKFFLLFLSAIFITFFSINQVFGQEKKIDSSDRIQFLFDGGMGLTVLQNNNSPTFYAQVGLGLEELQINLLGTGHYLFSNSDDGSKERAIDSYLGLEFLIPYGEKKNWSGIGVSYCIKNQSKLQKTNPIKAYAVRYYGWGGISLEYIWGDFFYPAIGIRWGLSGEE